MLTRALSVRLRPRLAATCAAASCDRGRCTYASAAPDVEDAQPKVTRSPSSSPAEAAAKGAAAMAATVPTILQPRVLIYDGVCHLCHRGVKWVIKADKYAKIKFCCLQSKAAEPYLRLVGMDREDVLRRVLFIEGPEAYYEGSTALLKVASYLPLPYSVLSSLLIVPVPLRDAIYDYIAKHRYDWLGKDDECIVIENKELLERFIDRDELLGGGHGDGFF